MSDDVNKSNAIVLANKPKSEQSARPDAPNGQIEITISGGMRPALRQVNGIPTYVQESIREVSLSRIETSLSDDASDEEAAAFVVRWNAFKALVKEIDGAMKAELLRRLVHTKRDLTVGEVRYYAGDDKSTICIDIPGTVDAMLQAVKGNIEDFAAGLVAQPFKPGHVRQVLPSDVFDRLFTTNVKSTVKEGKPKLCSINPKFIK